MINKMILLVAAGMVLGTAVPLGAQGHASHRHPRGAKILITGVLVEPLCQFAQPSAVQDCLKHLVDGQLQPALLDTDSTLYLLRSPAGSGLPPAQARRLLGHPVKVDGTVFPAGNAYLIVVDSLRLTTP
jgi:hypothetical protein